MLKIWLKHKIFEYCIDIFFREFFRNFIFPQITPNIYLTIENNIIIVEDDKNNKLSRKLLWTPINSFLYMDEITKTIMDFLKKYHKKTYHIIINDL